MELTISKPNLPKPIKIVPMDNKPKMAVALENPKLRDYTEEELTTNCALMVAYLLNLLGVGEKGKLDHHNATVRFMAENFLQYTFQEIKLAFNMYVRGEFMQDGKPMLVTQQLNPVVLGRVMREYQYRKDADLDQYRRKRTQFLLKEMQPPELTQEQKDAITADGALRVFNEYKEFGQVLPGESHIYDYLVEKGFLKVSENEWSNTEIQARINVKKETKIKLDMQKKEFVKNTNESDIKAETKRLLLEKYFENRIKNETK